MMRDIKFRGWNKTARKWIYGDLRHGCKCLYIKQVGTPFSPAKIDYDSVGQYTEIKDNNWKEIYEGDILGVTIINRRDGSQRKPYNLIVVYKNGAFVYQYIQGGWKESNIYNHIDNWADDVTFEIIGNRYENPDLLKERENG